MICKKCNINKDLSDFQLRSNGKHRGECKECTKMIQKELYLKRKEKNSVIDDALTKKCLSCGEVKRLTEYHKARGGTLGVSGSCKACRVNDSKNYYSKNSEKIKARTKKYISENKPKIQLARRKRSKVRRKTDFKYKVKRNLRNRLWYALKHKMWKKSSSFSKYIGLENYDDLMVYLKSKFSGDMTVENYGEVWEIDHLIPLDSAENIEHLYKLSHYTNLIPKTISENRAKSNKFNFNTEYMVKILDYKTATDFHVQHHYLHRAAPIQYAFGLFLKESNELVGVCTFAVPLSPGLRNMICGEEYSKEVIELNRLVLLDKLPKNTASWFISSIFRMNIIDRDIVVSFADTAQGHEGTIYKAANFIYTGLTDKKKDMYVDGIDSHSATIAQNTTADKLRVEYGDKFGYVDRSQKHRYIFFLTRRSMYLSKLKLDILEYP